MKGKRMDRRMGEWENGCYKGKKRREKGREDREGGIRKIILGRKEGRKEERKEGRSE